MTEADWLASTDPEAMFRHLVRVADTTSIDSGPWRQMSQIREPGVSDRKLRLFIEACYGFCREKNPEVERGLRDGWPNPIADIAVGWARNASYPPKDVQAALLRDLFGNVFKKIRLGTWLPIGTLAAQTPLVPPKIKAPPGAVVYRQVPPPWLAWHDGTVPKIAQAIYDGRRFEEMPILADALEEAGCDRAELPRHCREGGPHVRGCWVLDLLLGKE